MVLHLTAVILFQQHTGCIVHVPGKLVPIVVKFLESRLDADKYFVISRFQHIVANKWKASSMDPENTPRSNKVAELVSEDDHDSAKSLSQNVCFTSDNIDLDQIDELKRLVIKPQKPVLQEN